eukprot:338432-Rhodomonas_salina.4
MGRAGKRIVVAVAAMDGASMFHDATPAAADASALVSPLPPPPSLPLPFSLPPLTLSRSPRPHTPTSSHSSSLHAHAADSGRGGGGQVGLIAATDALRGVREEGGAAIMTALVQGEAWDNVGSRRLFHDMLHFTLSALLSLSCRECLRLGCLCGALCLCERAV